MASRSQGFAGNGFAGHMPEAVAYDPHVDRTGAPAPYRATPQGGVSHDAVSRGSTSYDGAVSQGSTSYDGAVSYDGVVSQGSVPGRSTAPVRSATSPVPSEPHGAEPWDEWNPTEESTRPLRGKHRVAKQRTGGVARGGAVLGVGMIAAVGAGGMATAQDKGPGAISVPDLETAADTVRTLPDHLPDTEDLPGIGTLLSDDADASGDSDGALGADGSGGTENAAAGRSDAGEALRARILAQAEQRHSTKEAEARETAARQAATAAAEEAAKRAAAAEERAEADREREAAEKRRKAEAEQKRKAEAEQKRKAEAERRAKLARSYTAPLASSQLTAGFGQAGGMWQSDHTGQDFAAPNGTPVKAIHSGTIKEAGWAGSYGYRIVLRLENGTELWFCHLSSMTKSAGDKVGTGDVIGRVGSTGNSSGPHLHVEVRPDGGDPVDPLPWLRAKGVDV